MLLKIACFTEGSLSTGDEQLILMKVAKMRDVNLLLMMSQFSATMSVVKCHVEQGPQLLDILFHYRRHCPPSQAEVEFVTSAGGDEVIIATKKIFLLHSQTAWCLNLRIWTATKYLYSSMRVGTTSVYKTSPS